MQLLNEFRSLEFNDRYRYVVTQLRQDHDPQLGISGLPDDARRAVYDIAYFYQGFGALRRLRIIDDRIMSVLHHRILAVWEAVAPYVERERELSHDVTGPHLMSLLEGFAQASSKVPADSVVRLASSRAGR